MPLSSSSTVTKVGDPRSTGPSEDAIYSGCDQGKMKARNPRLCVGFLMSHPLCLQASVVPASLFSSTLAGLIPSHASTSVSVLVTHRSVSLAWASSSNSGYLIDRLKCRASSTKHCGISVPQTHTCTCTHLGTHSHSAELELPQL